MTDFRSYNSLPVESFFHCFCVLVSWRTSTVLATATFLEQSQNYTIKYADVQKE